MAEKQIHSEGRTQENQSLEKDVNELVPKKINGGWVIGYSKSGNLAVELKGKYTSEIEAWRAIQIHKGKLQSNKNNTAPRNPSRKPKHKEDCKVNELKIYDARKCTCGVAKKNGSK